MTYHTYILKCSDDSYYVGHAKDLEERLVRHSSGRGPKYTADRRPVVLVHSEEHSTKSDAAKRERQIKKWSGAKKQALISGDLPGLKTQARCRTIHGKPT